MRVFGCGEIELLGMAAHIWIWPPHGASSPRRLSKARPGGAAAHPKPVWGPRISERDFNPGRRFASGSASKKPDARTGFVVLDKVELQRRSSEAVVGARLAGVARDGYQGVEHWQLNAENVTKKAPETKNQRSLHKQFCA